MFSSASLLVLLLLGLSQASSIPEHQPPPIDGDLQWNDHQEEVLVKTEGVDISTQILSTNNGSDVPLLEGDLMAPTTRNAMKCFSGSCFWRKGADGKVSVPYEVSRDYPPNEKQLIESAMRGFGRTCIRFVPRTRESDYISIQNRGGCYSALGREGGRQELSLNRGGCMYSGVIQHELNHALGFQHEQTRSDRDQYVLINWQNIEPSNAYNFQKSDTNNQGTPYDYGSIMHYGRTAFAIANGLETITPIPNRSAQIGQRQGLSRWDTERINKLYKC